MVMEQPVKSNQFMWNYAVLQEVGPRELASHDQLTISIFYWLIGLEFKATAYLNESDTMISGAPRQ